MLNFFLFLVVIIVLRIIWSFTVANWKNHKQGGMKIKYARIVNGFLNQDPNTRILHQSPLCIKMGSKGFLGATILILTQVYDEVEIEWEFISPILGKHQLKWKFPDHSDQDAIYDVINEDVGEYSNRVLQNSGMPFVTP